MKILIVKTSSLGDIIQCFPVLNYLHQLFPDVQIDWVVEKHFASVVQAHPLVHRTIERGCFKELRKEKYDYVFDLQGNCKSGLITLLSKAAVKIGFSYASVREWPNILATQKRFSVPKAMNIRMQYLSLMEQFFQIKSDSTNGVRFNIDPSEEEIIRPFCGGYVMVCPGSNWINKQLKVETLIGFLHSLHQQYQMRFLFVWGTAEEKENCEKIQRGFPESQVLPIRLKIPTWQYLMNEMKLLIAVDSSALHLCGTTKTPSFSVFGPTSSSVFKPLGLQHYALQGQCPYGRSFLKQCPILRSCSTGACIRDIQLEILLKHFGIWWSNTNRNK